MTCCRVNKCCCCIHLPVGVRIISLFLILVEILLIVLVIQLTPQFIFFAVPTWYQIFYVFRILKLDCFINEK